MQDLLRVRFRSGHASRTRSVSHLVLSATLDVPVPPVRLKADWEREIASRLQLEPGDVEPLPLARARARWPGYPQCVRALADWTRTLGLHDAWADSDAALMACRGARYHHDGEQYGGMAFCNLFLSEDVGLDVHFAVTGHRIALARGTALIFDTGQPHAVVRRGSSTFDAADFAPDRECTEVFLTWELPVAHAGVQRALGIRLDVDATGASPADAEGIWRGGRLASVCPTTGRWRDAR